MIILLAKCRWIEFVKETEGYFHIRITNENGKRAIKQAYPLYNTIK